MKKRVEIHYIDAKGNRGVVNRLSGENTALSNAKGDDLARRALIDRAQRMADAWHTAYPDDRFIVVEV
jgi:hypothetical protein